jgi:hypothetical protein
VPRAQSFPSLVLAAGSEYVPLSAQQQQQQQQQQQSTGASRTTTAPLSYRSAAMTPGGNYNHILFIETTILFFKNQYLSCCFFGARVVFVCGFLPF